MKSSVWISPFRQSLIKTYQDFEYIIIDGASTDGNVDFIKRYADRLADSLLSEWYIPNE